MPQTLSDTLLSLRDLLTSAGPFVVLAALLLGLTYWWLDPMPPKHVTLATGPDQSACMSHPVCLFHKTRAAQKSSKEGGP